MTRFKCQISIAVSTILLASICSAQLTYGTKSNSEQGIVGSVITGNGVPNYIPIWTSSNSLSSSVIYQTGGSVGVGTTSPVAALDVNGSVNAGASYGIGGSTVLYTGSPSLRSVFVGQGAGSLNSRGNENSFVGNLAGNSNAAGGGNSFFGYESGVSNSAGGSNSFFGAQSGASNTSGAYNTFLGWQAGATNGTGINNSFFGSQAGYANTTGSSNISIGANAGGSDNTNGGGNIFVGVKAGYNNASGGGNTIIGFSAGVSNTSGSYNLFDGYGAGEYNTTGSNNIYLGNVGIGSENNTIRIGMQGSGLGQQNTTYIAGVYGTPVSGVPVYVSPNGQLGTQPSSIRFKEHIKSMGDSTDALMKLRPVTFFYKADYDHGPRTPQYGLIAEEVAAVYPELVSTDNEGRPYTVRYQYLPAMLLNEVQKQYHRAEAEDEVIKEQREQIANLERRLSRLESLLAAPSRSASTKSVNLSAPGPAFLAVTLPVQVTP